MKKILPKIKQLDELHFLQTRCVSGYEAYVNRRKFEDLVRELWPEISKWIWEKQDEDKTE